MEALRPWPSLHVHIPTQPTTSKARPVPALGGTHRLLGCPTGTGIKSWQPQPLFLINLLLDYCQTFLVVQDGCVVVCGSFLSPVELLFLWRDWPLNVAYSFISSDVSLGPHLTVKAFVQSIFGSLFFVFIVGPYFSLSGNTSLL